MHLSRVAQSISESVTLKLNATAAALRKAGEPLIHLGGGEPVTLAPAAAVKNAEELFRSRAIRYAPASGLPDMKAAVVDYTQRFYGHPITPANVLISSGAKQAIAMALTAIVDPGDEVVFAAPYWVSYPEMVKLAGGLPVVVEAGDGGFVPSLADFEAKLTEKTRAIIINSPSNPTGAAFERELMQGLFARCEERGIYILMDDIYHRLVFDGFEPPNPFTLASDNSESSKLVVINGVSKSYAMTGYRIGWAVAAAPLVKVMGVIQGHQTSGPSSLTQLAAIGAIAEGDPDVAALVAKLQENRDLLLGKLQAIEGVKVVPPKGTFYCFADVSAIEPDSSKLAAMLLEKVLVAAVPGVAFGRDGHLRISTCGSAEDITEGCRRLAWALDPNAGATLEIAGKTLHRDG
ncbi:MAG: aminotransferase [Proteobacteria bacterium]|nr:MAG: aminotransferase [Pseudomonadota bacterium]